MISIYLCDDEPIWLRKMEQTITSYLIKNDWDISIAYSSSSPSDLLSYLTTAKPSNGIYFLDICFHKPISGLDLGLKIQELDPNPFLIYITTYKEFALETIRLKLRAIDFIIKDSDNIEARFHSCLDYCQNLYTSQNNSSFITLSLSHSLKILSKQEIYCVESIKGKHKINIYTTNELLTIAYSIKDIQEKLGSDFLLCNKGCLVNKSFIASANKTKKELLLKNGQICPCSIRLWKHILEQITY